MTNTLHPDRWNPTSTTRKLWVVVHDSESSDGSHDALIRALQSPGDRPTSSGGVYGSGYHAVTDGKGGYTQVADATMGPFAAPPLNGTAWHVCIPGVAAQTRDQWLDPTSRAHIRGVAKFIVDHAVADGIPLVKVNAQDMLMDRHGYCGHRDVSDAWHRTDHYDPGSNFPWDVLAADIAALYPSVKVPAPTLRRGMRSDRVVELKKILVNFNYMKGATLTDYYGTGCVAGVRRFQTQAKLTVDGVYGPQTAKALQGLIDFTTGAG